VRAVVQRVAHARVLVDGEVVGRCGRGMLVLLGVMRGDGDREARRLAERIGAFRFFEDSEGRMNESIVAARGSALVVSQFTLAADGRKGRRPSFDRAAPPEIALPLYEAFAAALEELGIPTERGVFGAEMVVELANEGPVTFVLDELPRETAPTA
jgi:D-aminoacyl-tRNA deacylase